MTHKFMETQNFVEFLMIAVSTFFTFIFGHNLWLVARDETDEMKIELITSDKFPESDSAVNTSRIADFRGFTDDNSFEINDYKIEENSLVASLKKDKRLKLVALELYPHPIVLETEKFAGYIKSEAAEKFIGATFDAPQRESYAKFAKVLIANDSFEKVVGQKFEIILLTNPSNISAGERLKVKVLFDGKPLKNLRVTSGAQNLNDGKYFAHSRTDADGLAEIEISGGGLWFVRTHFIRPHFDADKFDYESFWASVTFTIH